MITLFDSQASRLNNDFIKNNLITAVNLFLVLCVLKYSYVKSLLLNKN